MTFDPTAYGTFRYGYDLTSATWKGANRSGGYAAITALAAISGSAASNNLTKDANRNWPVVGCVGGQHLDSWRVGTNQQCASYKVAGTSFDTSTATGLCAAGFIAMPRQFSTVNNTNPRVLFQHSNKCIVSADGAIPRLYFTDATPTVNDPGIYIPASLTPFVLRVNSGGWRMRVGGYSSAFTGSQTGGNASNVFYHMCDNSQGNQWWNAHAGLYFYDGDTTSMSNAVMDTMLTAMLAEYPTATPTTYIAMLGHSWQAGCWGAGADSVSGLVAEAFPTARVYNFGEGGALASQLTTQITRAITGAANCGFTPTQKIAHIMIGENEIEAISVGTFAADIAAAKAALIAAGFKIVFADVHPFSHVGEADATVVSREAIRTTLRANLASINTGTTGGCYCMTYTDRAPWYVNYTGASTNALKAVAVRKITDSRLYEISTLNGDDPTALTDSQELHPGSLGIRQLATQAIAGISQAVTFATTPCTQLVPIPVRITS